jgi:hypothetical protein
VTETKFGALLVGLIEKKTWHKIAANLVQGVPSEKPQDNPWFHGYDFVIPPWEEVQNGILNLNKIKGVYIGSLTTNEVVSEYPDYTIWADNLVLSKEVIVPPSPYVGDEFEYETDEDLNTVWEKVVSAGGRISLTTSSEHAPILGSTKSAKIVTCIPDATPRYEQIQTFFKPTDWQDKNQLVIWVKGDGFDAEPWGGELSICVIDGGSPEDEVWQSTRWFKRTNGWTKITINLQGATLAQGNSWDHPNDFVIPTWETVRNGKLDKDKIKGLYIKSLTTTEWLEKGYLEMTLYVDHFIAE